VLFGRYVFQYHSSLYLPPMHHIEAFLSFREDFLPFPAVVVPGAVRYNQLTQVGVHYHLDYLTPYWDAEGGYRFDVTVAEGLPIFDAPEATHQVTAQLSTARYLPDLADWVADVPGSSWLQPALCWLADTRVAARAYGAAGLPDNGEFFALGGSMLFRGFDLAERQGSAAWVGSLEWRVPLARQLTWDLVDHCAGARNLYAALFYDVGDCYVNGHSLGPVAHALGVGLCLDVAWFGFVERSTLRLDIAKALGTDAPVQAWFSVQHPF
jgi:hypothetical protein